MKTFLFGLALAVAAAADGKHVPVLVGGNRDLDACLSSAHVAGVRTFLAVRGGPGASYPQLDALREGDQVYLCGNASEDSQWVPVVYVPGGGEGDCGVSSPIAIERPYEGRCKSGWVRSRWLKMIAG